MEVALQSFKDRFDEPVSQAVHASSKSLQSEFPQAHVPPREVIRCQSCFLVQFRTISDLCRRCRRPLAPKLTEDQSDTPAADAPESSTDSWRAASPNAPESLPSQIQLEPVPRIGCSVKRLRKERGVSQGQLGRLVGLRRTYLSRVENGHVMPGPGVVFRIAQALDVDIQDLFVPPPAHGRNGAVLREPTCVRLVAMFSELQPQDMEAVLSEARQMRAAGLKH